MRKLGIDDYENFKELRVEKINKIAKQRKRKN
jgi:hypothetical protein